MQALVRQSWEAVLRRSKGVRADVFVVMPNQVHGIIWIVGQPPVGAQHPPKAEQHYAYEDGSKAEPATDFMGAAPLRRCVSPKSLGAVVRTFKSITSRRINVLRETPGQPLWQRNYYERIIRDEAELARARQYIADNPAKWAEDKHNPANRPKTR